MGTSRLAVRRASVAGAVTLAGAATIALAAFAGVGTWFVVLVGAGVVGGLATLMAIGLSAASGGVPHARDLPIDRVTGIPNADKLRADLAERIATATSDGRFALLLLVLKGLDRYNEAYGEPCADALLAWLARKLRDAAADGGEVYRLRGGTFAVLTTGSAHATAELRASCASALREVGEGFVISSTVGEVLLPAEAGTAEQALELADRRARADRSATPGSTELRPPEDPMEVMALVRPRYDVAVLAVRIGRRMGLPPRALEDLEAAAHLRDVGNMAVPTAVLANAGALPGHEWQFIRLHTIVGERLLAANFGMEAVAKLVRSSHERWDGGGYPDALSGEQTPLGSRIVFVCTAFQDMTSNRPHRPALEADAALAELERGAGTQFDPEVVRAFLDEFAAGDIDGGELDFTQRRPLQVLIADDDAASRFLLARGVELAGHDCLTVDNGVNAWVAFRAANPDVVICDWRLPEIGGQELCRRIHEESPEQPPFLVILIALEDSAKVRPGLLVDADALLTKPFDRHELEDVLANAAAQPRFRPEPGA